MGGYGTELGRAIACDNLGNVYTTGYFQDTVDFDPGVNTHQLVAKGQTDIFIQKLDSSGNFLWAKRIGGNDVGGEVGHGIVLDNTGNVYITGEFEGSVDFDPGVGVFDLTAVGMIPSTSDIFILKLDTDGHFLWAKNMGGNSDDTGTAITIDDSGYVYTTGRFIGEVDFDPNTPVYNLTSNGGFDIFIQKLDTNGKLVWAKNIGGDGSETVNAIAVDDLGNVHITGSFYGLIDLNPGIGVHQLNLENGAFYILKLDSLGGFLWAKSIGGVHHDESHGIILDDIGNVYTTGVFRDTVDFDPGPTSKILTALGNSDIFIQKLNANGDFLWAKSMGGAWYDDSYSVSLDDDGKVYVVGSFTETTDFDPNESTYRLTSKGSSDIFVLKLNEFGNVDLEKNLQPSQLTLHPNPSNGLVNITLPEGVHQAQVHLANTLGQTVYQQPIQPTQNQLNLTHLPNGIYHVTMRFSLGVEYRGKMILVK